MSTVVYANGDSFTAGSELAADLLPGFPGNTVNPPIAAMTRVKNERWYNRIHQEHGHLMEHYIKQSTLRAYPQKVGNILDCEVFNNALGGSSMDRIARTTISDLIKLKKEHTNIVAVIGTTDIHRIELPNENKAWASGQPAHNVSIFAPVYQFYVKYSSSYHALSNYYNNLISIQDFCKVNNIRLILLDAMSHTDIIKDEELTHLVEYVRPYDIDMSKIAQTTSGEVYAPLGHYTEIVHDRIAEEIVKIL